MSRVKSWNADSIGRRTFTDWRTGSIRLPDCQVHLRQAADLASFQPLLYAVVDVTTVNA